MKPYYEAHVTFTHPDRAAIQNVIRVMGWKFSAIDGDPNLGAGVKCYATRQMADRRGETECVRDLLTAGSILRSCGATVLREKIESVVYDTRSGTVECNGACPECIE